MATSSPYWEKGSAEESPPDEPEPERQTHIGREHEGTGAPTNNDNAGAEQQEKRATTAPRTTEQRREEQAKEKKTNGRIHREQGEIEQNKQTP